MIEKFWISNGAAQPASIEDVANVIVEWATKNNQLSPDLVKLEQLLNGYFGRSDIESLCFNMGIDDEQLRGQTKAELARSLLRFTDYQGMLSQLKSEMGRARPNLRSQLQ